MHIDPRIHITPRMIAREVLRICGSGSITVGIESAVEGATVSIYGLGDVKVLNLREEDLRLSLDDFYERHLKEIIPEVVAANSDDCHLPDATEMAREVLA